MCTSVAPSRMKREAAEFVVVAIALLGAFKFDLVSIVGAAVAVAVSLECSPVLATTQFVVDFVETSCLLQSGLAGFGLLRL